MLDVEVTDRAARALRERDAVDQLEVEDGGEEVVFAAVDRERAKRRGSLIDLRQDPVGKVLRLSVRLDVRALQRVGVRVADPADRVVIDGLREERGEACRRVDT